MEGTRNERSVLIIISYVIGFVTAFILYNSFSDTQEELFFEPQVSYINKNSVTQNSISSSLSSDVFHLDSLDMKNTFVCKNEATKDYCTAYILSNDTHTETPVLLDNQVLTISTDLLAGVKWSDRGLTIHEITSASNQTPWLLVNNISPIDLQ